MLCTVRVGDGIPYVQPEPDLFMAGELEARPVVAAVMAFHRARGGQG
jgi:hypothetical protein